MLFQTLDDKNECVGVYYDGDLYFDDQLPENLDKTWAYASFLSNREIRYGNILCNGKSLSDACPAHLKEDWEDAKNKLKAYHRSFCESKVDMRENCFYDLVPRRFLLNFCEIKNRITDYVFENYKKPKNYDFMVDLHKFIKKLEFRKLNIDRNAVKRTLVTPRYRHLRNRLLAAPPYIKYDPFGTKTGRLSTKKNSFPILTIAREHRAMVKPNNQWFVEFDFNAAELRTLLGLCEKEQPNQDIHDWNVRHVYKSQTTRENAKQRVFSWLYNPKAVDNKLSSFYDRDFVLQKYFDGSHVQTFFGRDIPADDHHALNYIIQSTTSDLFLRRVLEVDRFLKDKKSDICFTIHDSLVIDLAEEEKYLIPEIKKVFSDTELGTFKVNISAGKDFGNMKELKL